MSLFEAMEEVIRCPVCGGRMELQSQGIGDYPYFECLECGFCHEVRR